METVNKYAGVLFKILSVLFLIAIGVCLIIDFIFNKQITWSGFVISSVILAWILLLPLLLAKSNKILLCLTALSITVIPFLFALEMFTPKKDWAFDLGLPIAVINIITVWIMYFILRFLRINKWYMSAIAVFLFGVVSSTAIRYFLSNFMGGSFLTLDGIINVVSCLVITVSFVIIGKSKEQSRLSE